MKKILSVLSCTLALSTAISLAACGGKSDDNALNVVVLSAGYGREWIDEVAARYTAETGVKVSLTAEYDVGSIISSHMGSGKNPDDLYISTSASWKAYAAGQKFADLSDLLNEETDGVKISEKLRDEYADSIWYTDRKGEKHCYRLPWTSGAGGIFYNKKMFADNGWEVPKTYDELVSLCDTIRNAALPVSGGDRGMTVKPFVFTGENQDYFDYTVFTWWAQLAGTEAIEEFLAYSDASAFATKASDGSALDNTYSKLKKATEYWAALLKSENYVEDSIGKSNHIAQQNFVNGYAAMIFDADWLYNEILGYKSNNVDLSGFELGIMDTPVLPDAKYTDVSYTIGEDQFIAIPASSDRIDDAKEFIKYVVSDAGISSFFNKGHGLLAYKSTTELSTDDAFMKEIADFRSAAPDTFTNFSNSLLYLSNVVDIWATGSLRPYNAILQGTNSVDAAFDSIQSTTASSWATWCRDVGLS